MMPLTISVFSDVVCPWCFIGKRRLERALDEVGLRASTVLEWLPFELNPDMPEDGMPRAEYRTRKFGAERAATLDAEMTARGRDEGIAFAFDRIERTPSTRKAHRVIAHATRAGRGDAAKEALMAAYFEQALDIGREDVLIEIATGLGLDSNEVTIALRDPALEDEIVEQEGQAAAIGVSGVPFFIVDRRWAVSGAQPSQQWVAALREHAGAAPAAAG